MPELPEVETTLRGIQPSIQDQIIHKLLIRRPNLRWVIPEYDLQQLVGLAITEVTRRGKYLLLSTCRGHMLIHLGMSGRLRILDKWFAADKHDHIDILFNNGTLLRFTDPRRFGAWLYTDGDPKQHPLLKNLGIEPLSRQFNGLYLKQHLANKRSPIKTAIMDQHIVVGVGNIYVTEALFKARINPLRPANSLLLSDLKQLARSIKAILRLAITQGGSSLKDFLKSDGKPGYFTQHLNVYGRAGLPCLQCQTCLQQIRIGQRSSVYCQQCQL
ncbi:MAG: bifunctional DNA-formamidopyrimidine glycosylase/DNA-(apurinic or apyrimidinic site) lyase [Candidatus Aquirickettsiella sp.]